MIEKLVEIENDGHVEIDDEIDKIHETVVETVETVQNVLGRNVEVFQVEIEVNEVVEVDELVEMNGRDKMKRREEDYWWM